MLIDEQIVAASLMAESRIAFTGSRLEVEVAPRRLVTSLAVTVTGSPSRANRAAGVGPYWIRVAAAVATGFDCRRENCWW